MQSLQVKPSTLETDIKQKYILDARSQIDTEYKTIIPETNEIVHSDETIIRGLQRVAFLYEQLYIMWDQEWDIPKIGERIWQDLKMRKFPRAKAMYVYDALYPYRDKYFKRIDHSSIQSSGMPDDVSEDFYKEYSRILETLLNKIKTHYDANYLLRRDNQDLQADMSEAAGDIAKILQELRIPTAEITDEDTFNLKKQAQKEAAIKYPETIPAKTRLSMIIQDTAKARMKVAKNVEEEGVIDPISGMELLTEDEMNILVNDFMVELLIWKPVTDRKYKRDLFTRYKILKDAEELFKRSAAKKHGAMTTTGVFVPLTREIIGSWQTDRAIDFDKAGKSLKHIYDFCKIWYVKVRLPRTTTQTHALSDKLSESAFGRE